MARILVTYYTKSGNTKTMAEAVLAGIAGSGATGDIAPAERLEAAELLDYDGFLVGSPVYYGLPAAPIKALFDASVVLHGRLAGRVGAAFASSANIGGGNETTCLAILQMMLVHGMVVVGSAEGDHYGPVSIGAPDARALAQCKVLGERVGKLACRLGAGESVR